MTETATTAKQSTIERVKTLAAVVAAVAGALTGLWGVYEKVRQEARKDTAASYNTLAPQVNQLGEALKQLQQENQQLRAIVGQSQGRPRLAVVPKKSPDKPRRPAAADGAGGSGVAAVPAPAGSGGTVAAAPATPAEAAPESPTQTPAAPGTEDDPVEDLLRTAARTRAAIEGLRRVPESFSRVADDQPAGGTPPPAPERAPPPAPAP